MTKTGVSTKSKCVVPFTNVDRCTVDSSWFISHRVCAKRYVASFYSANINNHRLDMDNMGNRDRGQEAPQLNIHTTEPRLPLPKISWDEIAILGSPLGTGSFSSVHRVKLLKLISTTKTCTTNTPLPLNKGKEYALKRLQKAVLDDEKAIVYAAKDLMLEATILAQLPAHQHIIQLHAVSTSYWDEPAQGFLVLDQEVETLHFRFIRFKRATPIPRGIPFFNRSERRLQRRAQHSRISNIALGVARAMKFLHSHRIIYRDLKPANIGFDENDNVRIFDFGLSRIQPKRTTDRRLTGGTGTARYMAPEVARFEHYSFSCDVHAFAILLWEICTLERPYVSIGSRRLSNIIFVLLSARLHLRSSRSFSNSAGTRTRTHAPLLNSLSSSLN
jgi:serine/threonine protein kinase